MLLKSGAARLLLQKLVPQLFDLIHLILHTVKQVLLLFMQQAQLLLKPLIACLGLLSILHVLVVLLLVPLVFLNELPRLLVLRLHLLRIALHLLSLEVQLVPHV